MGRKRKGGGGKRRRGLSPWDNIVMQWDTPPDRVRLQTDSEVSISWPFGDDLAEVMSSLDDRYFKVFLDKAWALCQLEAESRPPERRPAFLAEQRRRLDGYRAERKRKR